MLVYPQLPSGAVCQYPVRKIRKTRTIVNEGLDGSTVRFADYGERTCQWTLEYQGLSDSELQLLREFFESVEGRLKGFTFVDPTANLLLWTEDLNRDVWAKEPFFVVTGGIDDPKDGTKAWNALNNGSADARMGQTLNVPGAYEYCFSVYVRGAANSEVRLLRGNTAQIEKVGPEWKRIRMSGRPEGGAQSTEFGLELAPGATATLFGPQLEVQPAASAYRTTKSRGGVYTDARFMEDRLAVTTTGPNEHSCVLRVLANAYNI